MKKKFNVRGYTLIETTVAIGVFLIFAIGIYGSLTFVFKGVYQSRIRILETAILNDEIESIKSLAYDDVGLKNGVPSGVLNHVKTLTRNGVSFTVTTTVRYVDDPFDGTAGGNPVDLAPDDYKLVELNINFRGRVPLAPLTFTAQFAQTYSETSTNKGSLFIHVVDANGLAVDQASASIINASTSPTISLDDLTGNDGWYKLVETPTGTLSYKIFISKSGYSSDFTTTSKSSNPNPTKLPASVTSHNITSMSFAIDQVSSINFHTITSTCDTIPSVPFVLKGAKLIGSNPSVYKFNKRITTDGDGLYNLTDLEWDTYSITATGTTYDIAGTIPLSPITILPNSSQDVYILTSPHVSNSILVKVKDASSGLPISGATINLSGGSVDKTSMTGLGFILQTDWSGGGNQVDYSNTTKYFADDSLIENNKPSGNVLLRKTGQDYAWNGYLESSTFDTGAPVNFNNITVTPMFQSTSTGDVPVQLQFATSASSSPASWDFRGPDGLVTSYYTPTNTTIYSGENGNRYARYKLFLSTANTDFSPDVSDVSFTYTNSCLAPGQVFFNGFSSSTYTLTVSKAGYTTATGTVQVGGNVVTTINLSP
ncbi:MAG: hypothetical protein AAB467_03765 [Patescibacteria group bacterium]